MKPAENDQPEEKKAEPKDEHKDTTGNNQSDQLVRYKVRNKAFFHNTPDESTRRNAFINHWNNAVLKPLADKNGFIYVIFTNDEGQTSKGWLSKDDLIAVK